MNLGTPAAAAPGASTAPAQGEPPVIEVEGLVKTFGRHRALDELDLTVQARAVRLVADPHDSDPVGAEATPAPGTEDPGLAPSDSIDTE